MNHSVTPIASGQASRATHSSRVCASIGLSPLLLRQLALDRLKLFRGNFTTSQPALENAQGRLRPDSWPRAARGPDHPNDSRDQEDQQGQDKYPADPIP